MRIDEVRLEKVARAALQVAEVVSVEGRLVTSGVRVWPNGHESSRTIIYGVWPASKFLTPVVVAGRWLQPEDTASFVINLQLLNKEPDLAVGQELRLNIDGKKVSGQIIGLVTGQAVGGSTFMDPMLYMNYDYLAKLTGQVGLTNRAIIETKFHDETSQMKVANSLDEHFRQLGIWTSQKETNAGQRALVRNIFAIVLSVLLLLALLFVAIGGLSLMGMMSLSVLERTKEMGILRSLGGSNQYVAQIVMMEGLFIGLLTFGASLRRS